MSDKYIYLTASLEGPDNLHWCQDRIEDDDIEYVRSDVLAERDADYKKLGRDYDRILNRKELLNVYLDRRDVLLRDAYERFKKYEMDVDDHPPQDHKDFMRKIQHLLGDDAIGEGCSEAN